MSAGASAHEAPNHRWDFRRRRFANWFPLGLTYATLYMGRYNFNVAKGDIGKAFHFDKATMGIVATAGFWVYMLAVLFNGPLADRFGGRRAILVGTGGAAALNLVIGLFFWKGWPVGLIGGLSVLYALNMYFQSFGALSVVKVNAAWFHVRERGVLGGVFGSMISAGYALAYGVCGWILATYRELWFVYVVPAATIATMLLVDLILVRDRPSHAGHDDFDTGDEHVEETPPASRVGAAQRELARAEPEEEGPGFFAVTRHVLSHPVIRRLAVAEFCTGIVRQGLLLYFPEFLEEVHGVKKGTGLFSLASTGITVGGIVGALACGFLSDYFFQSRRTPVAFIFYVGQIASLLALGTTGSAFFASFLIGFSCMWIFGVHGMLSGTASMDFGGRKAAATAAGLLDGIQYLGAGLTGFGLGAVLDKWHWGVWTSALVPFSAVGGLLMLTLWNAKPKGRPVH
jgi:OPA family glycerol-3-phosphate transporter-like MFS transporter